VAVSFRTKIPPTDLAVQGDLSGKQSAEMDIAKVQTERIKREPRNILLNKIRTINIDLYLRYSEMSVMK
jgi:hypothetical protein